MFVTFRVNTWNCIMPHSGGPENLKKARPKNSSNVMNQFHGIFWGDISHFLKVIFQFLCKILKTFFSWNWFISFYEFFWAVVWKKKLVNLNFTKVLSFLTYFFLTFLTFRTGPAGISNTNGDRSLRFTAALSGSKILFCWISGTRPAATVGLFEIEGPINLCRAWLKNLEI